jgi:mycothiol synthase
LLDDFPDVPLPQGLAVCPVSPDHYRAIWLAKKEAFADTFGSTPVTEDEYQAWLSTPHADSSLWQVAWDGDEVAGFVFGAINVDENEKHNRRRGYTDPVGVRSRWRRRGLARALLVRSLQVLRDRGMTEAGLNVDTQSESGALSLYESVGFRVVTQRSIYAKPLS